MKAPAFRPRTLAGRMFVWQLSVVLLVLGGVGFLLDRILEREAVDDITVSLERQAHTVRKALADADADLPSDVIALGCVSDVRVTVIRTDGVCSLRDPSTTRPRWRTTRRARRCSRRSRARWGRRRELAPRSGTRSATSPCRHAVVGSSASLPLTQVRSGGIRARAIVVGLLVAAVASARGALGRRVTSPLRRTTESVDRPRPR